MALQPLKFRPGIDKESTEFTAEQAWVDSDKVRFRAGMPEKMGGWHHLNSMGTLLGVPRAIHSWRILNGTIMYSVATHSKVYVGPIDGMVDVTPVRSTGTMGTNPIATTLSSNVLTITHTAHGATNGDYVTISGATSVGGIPADEINTEHELTYVDGDTYTVTVPTPASSAATGGGAAVGYEYQINIGTPDAAYSYGFGIGDWDAEAWGTARSTAAVTLSATTWSFTNWGEDLIMNPSGRALYQWDASNPTTRATEIAQAPSKVLYVMATEDRHLVCFGCNHYANDSSDIDTLQVRWCDQEDLTVWRAKNTNSAGGYLLQGGSSIVAAASMPGQYLVWTTDNLYSMQSVGPPYIFGFDVVGEDTGLAAPNAWATYESSAFWMSNDGFYSYTGGVTHEQSPIHRFVFDSFGLTQRNKTFAVLNTKYSEVTWFYPTTEVEATELNGSLTGFDTTVYVATTAGFPEAGSFTVDNETISYASKTDVSFEGCTRGVSGGAVAHEDGAVVAASVNNEPKEPCRYATYNFVDGTWWVGRLERTAWMDRRFGLLPIATTRDASVFQHDTGASAAGLPLVAYVQSGAFDIGEGDNMMFVRRIAPDIRMTGSVDVELRTRPFPHGDMTKEVMGTVLPDTDRLNVRIRGRQAAFRVESKGAADEWRLGTPRLDVQEDGRR